jgi:hypothetical protein
MTLMKKASATETRTSAVLALLLTAVSIACGMNHFTAGGVSKV